MSIEFTTFTAPEKVNPYAETVAKLTEMNDENAAVVITVPTTDAAKHILQFQKAANAIGKTARKRLVQETEKGKNVAVTFTLTERHKPRRGK